MELRFQSNLPDNEETHL